MYVDFEFPYQLTIHALIIGMETNIQIFNVMLFLFFYIGMETQIHIIRLKKI